MRTLMPFNAKSKITPHLVFAAAALLAVACSNERASDPGPQITPSPSGEPLARFAGPQPPVAPPQQTLTPQQEQADYYRGRGTIPVAMLLPLSGPQGSLGVAMLDAAQIALDDVDDGRLELIPADTRGTPEGARLAIQESIQRGARLILGPLLSPSVRAVIPWTQQSGISVISFSTDRTVAGNGVFVMGFLPRSEVERTVSFARTKGLRRFAALAPDNIYGKTVVQELHRAVGLYSGIVTSVSFYNPAGRDYTEMVRNFAEYDRRAREMQRLRTALERRGDEAAKRELEALTVRETAGDLSFDALILPDGGARLLSVAPLLPFFDVDPRAVQFIGTRLWDEQMISTEPALQGGWYAAPDPKFRAEFVKRYEDIYGVTPPRLATLSYDAVALASVLAQSDQPNAFSAEAITSPNGFSGIDGIFRFLPTGLVDRGLAVLEMRTDRPRVIDPAPRTFQRLTN